MYSASVRNSTPKYLQEINSRVSMKLKKVKRTCSEILETRQLYEDQVLEIYQEAFNELIQYSVTYSSTLINIKQAYDSALQIRDERISQFITQDLFKQ
ncbi:hypothetical protein MSG28_008393 [Choristoneura fumiferana]|uniref:Uncharacterized protein n=1 Tax=Choristoneura fumiferana TaxID=7141 RepID=A0ACC0J5T8_CHOFU|nr:hypothetical protein MSG28_008393 [Choristoneura fumiferana]